jgi:hypothetical protein
MQTAALITMTLATLASGATAALYAYRFRYYRRRYRSQVAREANHLDTIFSLQQQLRNAEQLHANG